MRYRVEHRTSYAYADPVDLADHMLHLLPRQLTYQRVVSASIDALPAPARVREGTDYFDNRVRWMFIDRPHDRFSVTMYCTVDVGFPAPPPPGTTPPWESVAAAARSPGDGSWRAGEFTFDSPMAPIDPAAVAFAAESFPPGRPILAGLSELASRIRRDFKFDPHATTISTPVAKVMTLRAGVCQDFSHLMISGLRGLGLPARYVSGYIRTRPPPGQAPRRGADQSHAWVGAWLGPQHGWIDLDPTNDLIVRDEHVVLGWGRDFGDVSPVRGVLLGGGKHKVSVGVDLQPLEEAA